MKRLLIFIFPTILYLNILQSCVSETIAEEIETAVSGNNIPINSKSEICKEGVFHLKITNAAPNTNLQIDSIEICNILLKDESTGLAVEGNTMLLESDESVWCSYGTYTDCIPCTMAVQTFAPWSPGSLPEKSTGMYVKIYGNMYTYIAVENLFLLCEGPMYFTFNGKIAEAGTTDVEFELYGNCPLYSELDGKMRKVLQTITFDVTVDEWE